MSADLPNWIEPGQPVAIISGYANDVVRLATVERLTKTRVVLDGGRWFPIGTLRKSTGRMSSERLEDAASPRVVAALRYQQARSLAYEIEMAVRSLTPSSEASEWNRLADLAHRLERKARRA